MPEKQTIKRARRDKREGKAASTQAGEFVREEIHHVREGKYGARSAKQAIAIGLSQARRTQGRFEEHAAKCEERDPAGRQEGLAEAKPRGERRAEARGTPGGIED